MKDAAGEARRWLAQAEEDLEVVRVLLDAGKHAAACFHAHQAAEKAAKALLYARGDRFVAGHGVLTLLGQAGLADPALLDAARVLDQFYIPTRYPNGLPGGTPAEHYTAEQAGRAREDAAAIVGAARARLGGGA